MRYTKFLRTAIVIQLACHFYKHSKEEILIISQITRDLSPNAFRTMLPIAEMAFSEKWLKKQANKRPNDALLYNTTPMVSRNQIGAIIREGPKSSEFMHPLAEAIIGVRSVLEYFDRTGHFFISGFGYRLISLYDVMKNAEKIKNIENKISKLSKNDWLPTLYELLVAISQSQNSSVRFIDETISATPDMVLDERIFVECKARTQFDENVVNFNQRVNRISVDGIFRELEATGKSFLVEIEMLTDDGIIRTVPILKNMLRDRLTRRSTQDVKIKIKFLPDRTTFNEPISVQSGQFWKIIAGFDGWREWHSIQSHTTGHITNHSNTMMDQTSNSILICIRSRPLMKSKANLQNTILDASKRQLKSHNPGIVRMLINSAFYGIGDTSKQINIKQDLDNIGIAMLESCQRLSGVRFDIVIPPQAGGTDWTYAAAGASRDTDETASYVFSPGVLLF